jgi:hypothetical protein
MAAFVPVHSNDTASMGLEGGRPGLLDVRGFETCARPRHHDAGFSNHAGQP